MYKFPEDLGVLRTWMAGQGQKVAEIVSERQAAYLAQTMAGTRFRFPAKGEPCHNFMRSVQKHLVEQSAARRRAVKAPLNAGNSGVSKEPKPSETGTQVSYEGAVIFTDGCAVPNPGAGGWSFVVYLEGEEILCKCGGERVTTNNRMELAGLLNALQWARRLRQTTPVRIYTDSEYAMNCATKWAHGWAARDWVAKGGQPVKNVELVKAIYELVDQLPHAKIDWCRGHAGELGNERADELAERGRLLAMTANDNDAVAA